MRSRRWWIISGTCCRNSCNAPIVVILNGGEAGVRNRTSVGRYENVGGNALGAEGASVPRAAMGVLSDVRSLEGLGPFSG